MLISIVFHNVNRCFEYVFIVNMAGKIKACIFGHLYVFFGADGLVTKLCLTLATPWTVCSLPGSSVHGVLQAKILECVAISFSRGSSPPKDRSK